MQIRRVWLRIADLGLYISLEKQAFPCLRCLAAPFIFKLILTRMAGCAGDSLSDSGCT